MNADGKPDIVLVDGKGTAWLRNPDWTRQVIFSGAEPPAGSGPSANFVIGRVSRIRHWAVVEPDGIVVYRQPVEQPDPQQGAVLDRYPGRIELGNEA